MSYFYCPNVEAGRQLRPIHHRVQGSPNGRMIHAPKSLVIVQGSTNVVSPAPSSSALGVANVLTPLVGGTERAFILYLSAINRALAGVWEVTINQSGVDDTFYFVAGGDQLTTDEEKADYYLALFITHSTTGITFTQTEGDGSIGNLYRWKAIYGPAFFRQARLNV